MPMHPHYNALFVAVDKYLRSSRGCFVAECFLDGSESEWILCARPTNENLGAHSLGRNAFKYFRLSVEDAEQIYVYRKIGQHLKNWIDAELHAISIAGE